MLEFAPATVIAPDVVQALWAFVDFFAKLVWASSMVSSNMAAIAGRHAAARSAAVAELRNRLRSADSDEAVASAGAAALAALFPSATCRAVGVFSPEDAEQFRSFRPPSVTAGSASPRRVAPSGVSALVVSSPLDGATHAALTSWLRGDGAPCDAQPAAAAAAAALFPGTRASSDGRNAMRRFSLSGVARASMSAAFSHLGAVVEGTLSSPAAIRRRVCASGGGGGGGGGGSRNSAGSDASASPPPATSVSTLRRGFVTLLDSATAPSGTAAFPDWTAGVAAAAAGGATPTVRCLTKALTCGPQLVGFLSLHLDADGADALDLASLKECAMTLGGAVVARRAAEKHASGGARWDRGIGSGE